ncbi:hypothetical protein V8C86DRAFT_871986 [Haematococcus lacustris]
MALLHELAAGLIGTGPHAGQVDLEFGGQQGGLPGRFAESYKNGYLVLTGHRLIWMDASATLSQQTGQQGCPAATTALLPEGFQFVICRGRGRGSISSMEQGRREGPEGVGGADLHPGKAAPTCHTATPLLPLHLLPSPLTLAPPPPSSPHPTPAWPACPACPAWPQALASAAGCQRTLSPPSLAKGAHLTTCACGTLLGTD